MATWSIRLVMTDCPHVGVGRVTRPISIFCCLIYGADEAGHFIFGLQIKRRLLPLCMLKFLNIVHLGSLDLLKFGEISVNISEMVQQQQPFNGLFSRTTWVSRYQKGKTNLDFTGARDSEWQWLQLGHMQVCTSLQTTTTPTPHHSFFTGRMPFLPPNQQRQSTEGTVCLPASVAKMPWLENRNDLKTERPHVHGYCTAEQLHIGNVKNARKPHSLSVIMIVLCCYCRLVQLACVI